MYGKPGHNEDKARQRNIYAKKHLQNDLDVQKDMERVHLQTIRNEKIRLQKELERMRNKGQYMVKRHGPTNHTQRLLKLRLTTTEQQQNPLGDDGQDTEQGSRVRSGLPEINQSKKKKPKGSSQNMTMEERLILRRRKEAEKMQDALVAKVGKLAEDFKKSSKTGMPLPRQRSVSPVRHLDVPRQTAGSPTSKSDSYYESRRVNRTRSKQNARSSIGDVDLSEAKNSVARRLLKSESTEAMENGDKERKPPNVLPENELPQNAEDLVFDQDLFAPDGHVRTIHLLPDPEEAFKEAKKARYLRWKGGHPNEKELTVDEMFGELGPGTELE